VNVAEQRQHPRLGVIMPVRLRVDGTDACRVVFSCDLSLGGVFLRMTEPLPVVGARATITFVPQERQPLELRVEVRRVIPRHVACAADLRPGVGVRFVELAPRQAAALGDLIARVAGAAQRPAPTEPEGTGAPAPQSGAVVRPAALSRLTAEDLFGDLPPVRPTAADEALDSRDFVRF
jgi:hypothetical protein